MKSAAPILIVGSMAFDDLELPSGSFKNTVGGSATYSAFAASLFAPVHVVAVVGSDFSNDTLEALSARGVDTSGIERAAGRTFRWAGRYEPDLIHRTTLDTQLNVFADFRPKVGENVRDTPIVLLGNIHPALQSSVLDQMSAPSLVVADTMNFWINGEPDALAKMLQRVDTLVINDEEAFQLSGTSNVLAAAREIRARGPKRLVIKRGEHGALLFDDAGAFAAPGFPLETVVDPTGAGDSFAGGFVGSLARQRGINALTLRRAMLYATATASFCVEAVGTGRVASITRDDVASRVESIRGLYGMI